MEHYTYRVIFSEEDQEWVGLCTEFPSLSFLDKDQSKAFSGISALVDEVVLQMKEQEESPPVSLSGKKYSGKLSVRILPELHQKLAIEAAETGVSLNRLIAHRLSL